MHVSGSLYKSKSNRIVFTLFVYATLFVTGNFVFSCLGFWGSFSRYVVTQRNILNKPSQVVTGCVETLVEPQMNVANQIDLFVKKHN